MISVATVVWEETVSDWNDWRYVLALAHAGKAAIAAEELSVDATTVLRRVKKLEEALDVQIFDRRGNSYQPTDDGKLVVRAAANMEAEVRPFEARIGFALPLTGSLRIMTSEDLAAGILDRYFIKFCRDYPGIKLDLIIDGRNLGLSHYEVDVAVQTIPPRYHEYEDGERISAVAWSYYTCERYTEPDYWPRNPRDLTHHPVIAAVDRPLVRRWLENMSPPIHPGLRSTSLMTLRQYALEGLGVAILPCYLGDTESDLTRLFDPIEALTEELWIVSHKDVRNATRVRAFFDCVGELDRDQRERIEGPRPSIRHRTRAQSGS